MHRISRVVALILTALTIGCGGSVAYRHEAAASSLTRADGTRLEVKCVSHARSNLFSISAPKVDAAEQRVTVIRDDQTLVVTADQITLNDEPYGKVPADAKKVRIEYDEEGFTVEADGEPITPGEIDATE